MSVDFGCGTMRCFRNFREKSKSKEPKSASELKDQGSTDSSGPEKAIITSSCSEPASRSIAELYEEKAHNLRVFSYTELKRATDDFHRRTKIGEGGFGSVYKGSIQASNGKGESVAVAIKKLNRDSLQGHNQWVSEVRFLVVVEHPNLVKLIGYCSTDEERGIERLLVYEYMPNKGLDDHLFDERYTTLPWKTRLEILLGAAQGLAYLHEGMEVQIIYRDFKASNILLDENFKPKLSDFGLAREGPEAGRSHVSTAVVGTYGYAAPDYIETGHLTTKSDVWSFGVVLYEILTGRRSLERNLPKMEQRLLEWIKQFPPNSKRFHLMIDPRLENKYLLREARGIAKLADSCLLRSPKGRPKMSQVVDRLKEIIQDSNEETVSRKSLDSPESEAVDPKVNELEVSESLRRRITHLAKLGEHIESASRRRFIIMQRAKVL